MSESILEMENALRKDFDRSMENLQWLAKSTFTPWIIIITLSTVWHHYVEKIVPRPYLDEFFHVQQAELYLQGRFFEWHPKITTPPGLYLASLAYLACLSLFAVIDQVNIVDLRRTNAAAAVLFPCIVKRVLKRMVINYDDLAPLDRTLPKLWSPAELNHATLNICLFPPLFFFFALYYTDVWSAFLVLVTIEFHLKKAMKSMIVAGIAALFFRQTNIFWVSIYLGGLQVVRTLRRAPEESNHGTSTLSMKAAGSSQVCPIHDPLVVTASFGDYVGTMLLLVVAAVGRFRVLIRRLKSYLLLLGTFGCFVIWNGGVVLGDKENHVPSLHLVQMLYIWPYIMFFSFPILYPYILNAIIPQKYLPQPFRTGSTRHRFPRLIVALPTMAAMLIIVHFNTIVHPFTLADNRHYTFYVFRLLLRHPANKYLAVPIYFVCAWTAITAFGGLPNVQTPPELEFPDKLEVSKSNERLPPPTRESIQDRGHHVSVVLMWLLASSLSTVTAPLVEPRYFIVPWLIWRLHVASPWPTGDEAYKKRKRKIRTFRARCKAILYERHDHRLWLETLWFLTVNWGTCYVFLEWGFEWQQEKGKVQRFMW
ncbi:MAG: hypothetical protein Q9209_003477 [Squamulea sp. 1 TL-2023]